MKKIMILGASILQLPAIIKARDLGLYVIAVDIDNHAIGFKYAHEHHLISTTNEEEIVQIASKKKIDGIMTLATDLPMRAVARAAETLNLVGISTETAIIATNKCKMRERLALFNVPIPNFYKINSVEQYNEVVKNFSYIFIVKPSDNSGSRGVYLVRSKDEINQAFNYAKEYSRNGELIVEEYMNGREVSVETFSENGEVHVLAITDKLTTGAPYFVETGHSQPAQFDKSTIKKIKKTAIDGVIALGINEGPSHAEIMVTEEGPKIVEIGARLGGDCISTHLVPLSTGIDLVECTIKKALNEEPELKPKFNRASAIRYFITNSGRIQSITGIEKAYQINGVHEITFVKNKGDFINDVKSSTDRIGFVIAHGENVNEAITSCNKAIKIIEIFLL